MNYLVQKVKDGDIESFDKIYDILEIDLKKMSSQYYISGSDKSDILQECRIGLWKAIKDYNFEAGMSFKNFAVNVCCKRHLITSVSHANRKKFQVHNTADSIDTPTGDDDSNIGDFIPDKNANISEILISIESYNSIKQVLFSKLTELEKSIISEYLKSSSYKEIAKNLNVKTKTVDNALMRIRKKAQELISGNGFNLN